MQEEGFLLLTGVPGIGKTTAIEKIVRSLSEFTAAGFYTREIRTDSGRQGFELVTLQGKRFLMAHVDIDSLYRVGKYGVDIDAIDAAASMTLSSDREVDIYIIDEIGKMECFSNVFMQRVMLLLDSGKPVVATIAQKGSGFISEVKGLKGAAIWEVTKRNRDEIPSRVKAWVRERMGR